MKKINENAWLIVFILFAIFGCLFGGCGEEYVSNNYHNSIETIVEIEGCEYFVLDAYGSYTICHKGNCKNPIHIENCPCLGKRLNPDTQ